MAIKGKQMALGNPQRFDSFVSLGGGSFGMVPERVIRITGDYDHDTLGVNGVRAILYRPQGRNQFKYV